MKFNFRLPCRHAEHAHGPRSTNGLYIDCLGVLPTLSFSLCCVDGIGSSNCGLPADLSLARYRAGNAMAGMAAEYHCSRVPSEGSNEPNAFPRAGRMRVSTTAWYSIWRLHY